MQKNSVDFTIKTLQECDIVEPAGLSMLFRYKMNDLEFLDGEAKVVAKEYRQRDMDAKNNFMEKL